MTVSGTSLLTYSLEQRSFQSQPPGLPASVTGQSQDCTCSHDQNTICFNSLIQVLICCHNRLPMPCRSDERECNALPPPRCITPPPVKSNGGADHAESDAEKMAAESDSDVEKQFAKSTGRGKSKTKPRKSIEKRKYAPFRDSACLE